MNTNLLNRKKVLLLVFAGLAALALNLYLYAQAFLQHVSGGSVARADECLPGDGAPKENPNKMLFISCGGFLE